MLLRLSATRASPRTPPAPAQPVRVQGGALVLGVRWVKWGLLMGLLCGACAFCLVAAWAAARGAAWLSVLFGIGFGGMLLLYASLVARFGLAAAHQGGAIRADASGFHHCLLPVIPWRHVLGVDFREERVGRSVVQELVLAIEPAFARQLPMPRRWDDSWVAPRLDAGHRLRLPLHFVRGAPMHVAGQVQFMADQHGARRIPDWCERETADDARDRQERARQVEEEMRAMLQLEARIRREVGRGPLTPEQERQFAQEMERAMAPSERRSRRFWEQAGIFERRTAHLKGEMRKVAAIFIGAGIVAVGMYVYVIWQLVTR